MSAVKRFVSSTPWILNTDAIASQMGLHQIS